MPLTDDDWIEVLDHMRSRLREVGLGDVERDVTAEFRSTQTASSDFVRYLSRLLAAISERSLTGYSKALESLREGIEIEGGGHVTGVEVVFVEGDARLYGTERLDLRHTRDFKPLIRELESLRTYLEKNGFVE